jgi:hypothetical protein
MAARLGHQTVGILDINGTWSDWETLITRKVLPRARTMALKRPDKLLVVLDRESRDVCSPSLARLAERIITDDLRASGTLCEVSIIVPNRQFECLLFADFDLVDRLKVFRTPISARLAGTTEEKKLSTHISACMRPNSKYDKVVHGKAIAQRMQLQSPQVLARSRSLQKFVKELSG